MPDLKIKYVSSIIVSILLISVCAMPVSAQRVIDYIDISNPFLRKIPIAIPVFRFTPEQSQTENLSKEITQLLSETLEFTGFFKLLNEKAFLEDLQKTGISGSSLNFKNWTAIGAELLITGGLQVQDKLIVAELRLFDTFSGRLLVGKKYKGWHEDTRKIIRRFCNEIIERLTGNKGFFDSQIAFVSNQTGNKEIFICDFDGYNIKQVTKNRSINLSPAWSHDKEWIAYTSYTRNKPDLYIRNMGKKRGVFVAFKGHNITPAWHPNRLELAAALSKVGNSEIYLLTGSGNIIKRLTFDWGIDVSPSWSPDGKKIAFVSNRSGNAHIYIKEIESDHVRRLTYEGKYNVSPSWSPKGDRIAFCGRKNDVFDIYVMNADGSRKMKLTRNAKNNESPTWSPDGNLIAFSSTRLGKNQIFVMTAYGTDQRLLLSLPGEQFEPAWSR
ncbi:MAG: Tol-Pal system beta propeller repeat protein TolB [Candidatus Magnetomorum sp.]|nr:Tol-Pal system beta propeller repeat protein TolB [Candidatus Magnetomorum sp.]